MDKLNGLDKLNNLDRWSRGYALLGDLIGHSEKNIQITAFSSSDVNVFISLPGIHYTNDGKEFLVLVLGPCTVKNKIPLEVYLTEISYKYKNSYYRCTFNKLPSFFDWEEVNEGFYYERLTNVDDSILSNVCGYAVEYPQDLVFNLYINYTFSEYLTNNKLQVKVFKKKKK